MAVNVLWLKETAVARKNGETKYFGEFSRNHD